jgi:hypothetical protein
VTAWQECQPDVRRAALRAHQGSMRAGCMDGDIQTMSGTVREWLTLPDAPAAPNPLSPGYAVSLGDAVWAISRMLDPKGHYMLLNVMASMLGHLLTRDAELQALACRVARSVRRLGDRRIVASSPKQYGPKQYDPSHPQMRSAKVWSLEALEHEAEGAFRDVLALSDGRIGRLKSPEREQRLAWMREMGARVDRMRAAGWLQVLREVLVYGYATRLMEWYGGVDSLLLCGGSPLRTSLCADQHPSLFSCATNLASWLDSWVIDCRKAAGGEHVIAGLRQTFIRVWEEEEKKAHRFETKRHVQEGGLTGRETNERVKKQFAQARRLAAIAEIVANYQSTTGSE